MVFTYNKHKFSPEAVRFIGDDLIVSASKDQSIHLIDLEGNQKDVVKHTESFASMAVVGGKYVVAADVKANILLYLFDEKEKAITLYE